MIEQVASIFSEVGLLAEINDNTIILRRKDVSQSLMSFFFFLFPEAVEKITKNLGLSIKGDDVNNYTFLVLSKDEKICSIACC